MSSLRHASIPDIEDIAEQLTYNSGCALKLIWSSSGRKDSVSTIEDLQSAIEYLKYEIERVLDLDTSVQLP
jgi:hypothetical protein